jgi:hypothetical protein
MPAHRCSSAPFDNSLTTSDAMEADSVLDDGDFLLALAEECAEDCGLALARPLSPRAALIVDAARGDKGAAGPPPRGLTRPAAPTSRLSMPAPLPAATRGTTLGGVRYYSVKSCSVDMDQWPRCMAAALHNSNAHSAQVEAAAPRQQELSTWTRTRG